MLKDKINQFAQDNNIQIAEYYKQYEYFNVEFVKKTTVNPIEKSIKLLESFPKIPNKVFGSMLQLMFDYNSSSEVGCVLFFDDELETWDVYVPRQYVTGGSVRVQKNKDGTVQYCNLFTGEVKIYPDNFLETPVANLHLHPFNMPTFSSIDDADVKGRTLLDLLISNINVKKGEFVLTTSFVYNGERFYFKDSGISDYDILEDVSNLKLEKYHENVANFIEKYTPIIPKTKVGSISYSKYSYWDNYHSNAEKYNEKWTYLWEDDLLIDAEIVKIKDVIEDELAKYDEVQQLEKAHDLLEFLLDRYPDLYLKMY